MSYSTCKGQVNLQWVWLTERSSAVNASVELVTHDVKWSQEGYLKEGEEIIGEPSFQFFSCCDKLRCPKYYCICKRSYSCLYILVLTVVSDV